MKGWGCGQKPATDFEEEAASSGWGLQGKSHRNEADACPENSGQFSSSKNNTEPGGGSPGRAR